MPRRKTAEISAGQWVRFVCTSLLDEIGEVVEAHSDGTCHVQILEGAHAGGGGRYNNAEFVAVEEPVKVAASPNDED